MYSHTRALGTIIFIRHLHWEIAGSSFQSLWLLSELNEPKKIYILIYVTSTPVWLLFLISIVKALLVKNGADHPAGAPLCTPAPSTLASARHLPLTTAAPPGTLLQTLLFSGDIFGICPEAWHRHDLHKLESVRNLGCVAPHCEWVMPGCRWWGVLLDRGPRDQQEHISHSWVQPRVFEALPGSGPLCGIKCQHGAEKVAESSGFFLWPLILLSEHLKHAPGTELGDML